MLGHSVSHATTSTLSSCIMAVLQLYFLTLFFVVSTKSSTIYSNTIVLDSNGNFNVSYKYNASSDKVEFCLTVNTTGWVGFGFAQDKAPNMMMGYDVALGTVYSNGSAYLKVGSSLNTSFTL